MSIDADQAVFLNYVTGTITSGCGTNLDVVAAGYDSTAGYYLARWCRWLSCDGVFTEAVLDAKIEALEALVARALLLSGTLGVINLAPALVLSSAQHCQAPRWHSCSMLRVLCEDR